MSRKKKKAGVRAHKVKSRGVWIAPDLERKIKGEGGRRGLSEPPYSYYLHLADLVLKLPGSADGRLSKDTAAEPAFDRSAPQSLASLPVSHAIKSSIRFNDLIPAPLPPIAPALMLPKLKLPKPPRPPKPPKLAAPKLPKQKQRGKLLLPKPPKREK
jgi:hypothetical protein